MENKSISIKKHTLKYSAILGIAIIISGFLFYITGNYGKLRTLNFIILLSITILVITTSLLSFRKKNNNRISLSESLKIGIGTSVLGGLMVTIWEILLLQVIDPSLIDQIEEKLFKRAIQKNSTLNQTQIERSKEIVEKTLLPYTQLGIALIEDLIVGFLISLIGGLIIRKKKIPIE